MGNVWIDFLTSVGGCKWNANRLFIYPKYWDREFAPQDSDLVIVLQSDSLFYHTFDASDLFVLRCDF